jgi:3-hydroxyanthranilate 3,4-dioxygenase
MSRLAPFNLQSWVAENRHLLKPPVGNKPIWSDGQFLVMVVGGPNARSDYHVNPGEELFYQIEGDIVLKIVEDGKPRDISLKQGDIFLLPAGVPHSPQRPANTIGLVVEHPKCSTHDHRLRWYCRGCGGVVHDFIFRPADIGVQIKAALAEFNGNAALRTCKTCGQVFAV